MKKNPTVQTSLVKGSKEVYWHQSTDSQLQAMCYSDHKKVCALSTIHKAEEQNLVKKFTKKRQTLI